MNRTGLKYYLRALGIGIIVTALLMGYSQKGQAQMTDEEILKRAAQLGMTEAQQGVLAELATVPPETNSTLQSVAESTAGMASTPTADPASSLASIPTAEPVASPAPTPTAEPTASPAPTLTMEPTASPAPTPTAEPTASPMSTPATESTAGPAPDSMAEPAAGSSSALAGETVTLVINRGESSVTVSKNLEELGLVEDYRVYDRYLCDNGYDHSISAGTHEIPLGATDEEITRIICKLR